MRNTSIKSMKTKIYSFLAMGVCLLATLALSACMSGTRVTQNPDGTFTTNVVNVLDTNRVDRVANQAALEGTTDLLASHPEWTSQFQQAADDLNLLAASPSINLDDILAIAQRLPVKELKSQTAKLSFEGATLLISLLDVPQLPADANADLQGLAKSIANGINTGIEQAALAPSPAPNPVPSPVTVPANAPAN
jgi:hypothetical protein